MKIHKFHKAAGTVYLNPVYVRDDGKYTIESCDRIFGGTWKRVYEVRDEKNEVVGTLPRLKDAKTSYEADI